MIRMQPGKLLPMESSREPIQGARRRLGLLFVPRLDFGLRISDFCVKRSQAAVISSSFNGVQPPVLSRRLPERS